MDTHTGTQEDREKVNDMRLQEEAAELQANRRAAELIGGGPLPAFFEGRSHSASLQVARNQKDDAQEAMQNEPNKENWLALKAARDDIEQQRQWMEANKYDVFGFGNSLGRVAPLKRIQASETALRTAEREQRQKRQAYAAEASEDNWWDLRLINIKIRALEADIEANRGEASFATFNSPSIGGLVLGKLFMNQKFEKEAELFERYARLNLQNFRRKQSGQPAAGSVEGRMLALNAYGPQPVPRQLVPIV
jgi:hypothetical protein